MGRSSSMEGDASQSVETRPSGPGGIGDRTLARLAQHAYSPDTAPAAGWTVVGSTALEAMALDPHAFANRGTGFSATLYRHAAAGYVLAFRGTDEYLDWVANLHQAGGVQGGQYVEGARLAQNVRAALGDRLVALTGHSLGGGIASVASIRTSVPAVTFNAAGVHDHTIERFGDGRDRASIAASGLIRRYTVDNDILTVLQEQDLRTRFFLADALGTRIRLADPDPLSFLEKTLRPRRILHAIESHSMDAVLRAMDQPAGAPRPEGLRRLFSDAMTCIDALPSQATVQPSPTFAGIAEAALVMACHARTRDMTRIDHVVAGADGRLFGVQGGLADASHRMVMVDTRQLALPPPSPAPAIAGDALDIARHFEPGRHAAPRVPPPAF
jgi:pimeloyl-ACP methyl ester carboxylesterase